MSARDALRRQRVASLLLRGLAPVEIALQLKRQGLTDPESGEAYPLSVIEADIAALHADWQATAGAPQQGRILAEIREARRAAWAKGDLNAILRGLQQEAALTPEQPPRARAFTPLSTQERELLL